MAERRRSGDNTDQERTERAVRDSEARLNAIFAQVPGAVGLFGSEGRSLFCSEPLGLLWDEAIPSRAASSSRRCRSFDNEGRLPAKSDYPGARALRGETVVPGGSIFSTPRTPAPNRGVESALRPFATSLARSSGR
jgi:hypothetical protein